MDIPDFYRGRSVFLTGATGFIGKAIVEKLLRCCPDVERIYVLVRPKRGVEPQQRINDLLALPLFSGCPIAKVTAVAGDVSLPGLGLSDQDRDDMADCVSVLLHSAATISFQEPMRVAVELNVEGLRHVVQLARRMKNLAALVHVSTAYSNCDRQEVREELYPPPADVGDMIRRVKEEDDRSLAAATPGLLGARPNTYTFTKALAENLLAQEADDLPVAIVRPSIVVWAWRDPSPGYVDRNASGVVGPFSAITYGTLRSVHCDPGFVADLIPVDLVVNTLLAVAWHTARERPAPRAKAVPKIYNCVTGNRNPAEWGTLLEYWLRNARPQLSRKTLWWPDCTFTPRLWEHNVRVALFMLVPAFFFDLIIAPLFGMRANLLQMQRKSKRLLTSICYFSTHEWDFADDNMYRLGALLSPRDRLVFPVDVALMDWESYFRTAVSGNRRHLDGDEARTGNSTVLYLLHKLTHLAWLAALFGLMGWLLRPLISKVWPSSTLNFIKFVLSKR